jgi:hypothetical protein
MFAARYLSVNPPPPKEHGAARESAHAIGGNLLKWRSQAKYFRARHKNTAAAAAAAHHRDTAAAVGSIERLLQGLVAGIAAGVSPRSAHTAAVLDANAAADLSKDPASGSGTRVAAARRAAWCRAEEGRCHRVERDVSDGMSDL